MNYRSFGGIPLRFDRDPAAELPLVYREGVAFAPMPVQQRQSAAEFYPLLGAAVPEARSVRMEPRVGPSVSYTQPSNQPVVAPPATVADFALLDSLAQRALAAHSRAAMGDNPAEPVRTSLLPPPPPNAAPPRPLAPQSRPPEAPVATPPGPTLGAPTLGAMPPVRAARPLMTSLLGASTRQETRTPAPPPAPAAVFAPPMARQPAPVPPMIIPPTPVDADPSWPSPFERMRGLPAAALPPGPELEQAVPADLRPLAPRPVAPPPAPNTVVVPPIAAARRGPPVHAMVDVFRTLSAAPRAPLPPARDRS